MTALEGSGGLLRSLLRRRGLRQFVKFCLVGATSTLISFAIFFALIEGVHLESYLGSPTWSRSVASTAAFVFAVSWGFFWNNRWTFREAADRSVHRRYGKFVLTNGVGLVLNLVILNVVAHLAPAPLIAVLDPYLKDPAGAVGLVAATGVVVFWNFGASKYWTFRPER